MNRQKRGIDRFDGQLRLAQLTGRGVKHAAVNPATDALAGRVGSDVGAVLLRGNVAGQDSAADHQGAGKRK